MTDNLSITTDDLDSSTVTIIKDESLLRIKDTITDLIGLLMLS